MKPKVLALISAIRRSHAQFAGWPCWRQAGASVLPRSNQDARKPESEEVKGQVVLALACCFLVASQLPASAQGSLTLTGKYSEGQLVISAEGPPANSLIWKKSSDLKTWVQVAVATNFSGTSTLTVPISPGSRAGFYLAETTPQFAIAVQPSTNGIGTPTGSGIGGINSFREFGRGKDNL